MAIIKKTLLALLLYSLHELIMLQIAQFLWL